jgi:hypothetical protein
VAIVLEVPGKLQEIDMDRVVVDAAYRRRVIIRLRQDRLQAEAQRFRALQEEAQGDAAEGLSDED